MYAKYLKTNKLKLFDVTLRDGLQSIPKVYSLLEKKIIFTNIIRKHNPSAIEIGSIVSPKILPQMENSIQLYKDIYSFKNKLKEFPEIYMLTPTLKSLKIASTHNINNLSFITSVSDDFQKKNINKNLCETKKELEYMMNEVSNIPKKKVKLYISCISECPISGLVNNMTIVNEILYYYYTYGDILDELCLSDTCGTLKFDNFRFIIDELVKREIDVSKLGLHLHNQPVRTTNLNAIIIYAMKNDIYRYDVSNMPEIGGCKITMENTNGNLSYEQIMNPVV